MFLKNAVFSKKELSSNFIQKFLKNRHRYANPIFIFSTCRYQVPEENKPSLAKIYGRLTNLWFFLEYTKKSCILGYFWNWGEIFILEWFKALVPSEKKFLSIFFACIVPKRFFGIPNIYGDIAILVTQPLWQLHRNHKLQTRFSRKHVFRANSGDTTGSTEPILMK